jgi:uncharacterized membrane protein YgcG
MGCSKKFTKSDTSVQCTVCGLWIHKACADISDEIIELLEKMKKETGSMYWACKPCTKYAQGMNHRLKEIEEDLKEVKQSTRNNTEAITNIEKKVEELAEAAKKNEGLSKADMEAMLREERDETRERKDRELNVILHGAEECGAGVQSGAERIAWDRDGCVKLFNSQNLRIRDSDIKFCRRIGPKGDKPRPLVIGFFSMATRNAALRIDLRSKEPELSLGPDLTKKQREEEANIWKELEVKNNNRTAEEMAKNVYWRLVGPKGERRMILSTRGAEAGTGFGTGANAEPRQQRPPNGQGRGAAQRGTARGWGTGRGGTARGGGTSGGGTSGGGGTSPSGARLLEPLRDDQPFRPRIASKRTREENQEEEMDEEDGTQEPPTKH